MRFPRLTYDDLKIIKKDDILFDRGDHVNVKFTIKEDPEVFYSKELDSNKLKWKGITEEDEVNFLITESLPHYGPKIYNYPAYTDMKV